MFHSGYTDKETNRFVLKILGCILAAPLVVIGIFANTFTFCLFLFFLAVILVSFIYGKIKGRF